MTPLGGAAHAATTAAQPGTAADRAQRATAADRAQRTTAARRGALPNLIVIGAMKCGTTALHDLLDRHPQVAMSEPKELNFFFGPDHAAPSWTAGNWPHGLDWYAGHFDPTSVVRGESSPGYTSPDHPGVAARIAGILPDARLVCLVRDPLVRAISQYDHHRAEGAERRPLRAALTDPHSQYVARGRYHALLEPFVAHFPREQLMVIAQEDLRADPTATVRRIVAFAGADPTLLPDLPSTPPGSHDDRLARLDPDLRRRLADAVRDDTQRLRALTGMALASWSV